MATPAPFTPDAVAFLRDLRANNRRDWFQPRKAEFDELLRRPMLALAALVSDALRSFAVDHVRPPERAVQRIYRDVRFSKDKSPYKGHVSALFPRAGLTKTAGAVFYFSLSPDGVRVATGLYDPTPVGLAAVRADIDRDADRLRSLTDGDRAVVRALGPLQGDPLRRPPKPYPADHPAADLLRRKQFYLSVLLPPAEATRPRLCRAIVDRFRAAAPFVDHLNRLVLAAEQALAGDDDDGRPKRPAPMF